MSTSRKIGFIGAGQMAEALARGFIDRKMVKAEDIVATDISAARKQVFQDLGATAADSNIKVSDLRKGLCQCKWAVDPSFSSRY